MIEALWSVNFVVPTSGSYGAGVVVLENGTVRGGDSAYYYVGNFRVKDDTLTAEVSINHYFGSPNNVFGQLNRVDVVLSGKIGYQTFDVIGSAVGLSQPIIVRFNRIAEISA